MVGVGERDGAEWVRVVSSVPLMKWHDEDSAASAGYDQDRAAWPQTYIHHVDHLGSVTVALFRPSSQDT